MRLGQRFIARETIIRAADSYEMVEEYPEDKYLPSYLLLGRQGEEAFHVLFVWILKGRTSGLSRRTIPARKSGKRI
jgi:hypothetical protein